MPRTGSVFLFMLAIMSLAEIAPSSGWAQGNTLLGEPEKLTFDGQSGSIPAWSPDGSKIAFESYRDGDSEIYVLPY